MGDVVIEVQPARIVITGVNFFNYASRYREAASAAVSIRKKDTKFDPVPYQLFCQSLELYLKAYIWSYDQIGRNTIRNRYGHNIIKLWEHSKSRDIHKYVKVTPLREEVIKLVGPYYKDRKFCYLDLDMIFDGYKDLKTEPRSIQTLSRLTSQLSMALHRPVYDASQPT